MRAYHFALGEETGKADVLRFRQGSRRTKRENLEGVLLADAIKKFLPSVISPLCNAEVNAVAANHWRSIGFVSKLILREAF